MQKKWLYNVFIAGFVLLYLATALISFCHAIEFFKIGNAPWMSMTLAAVFELGQMVVLSSLLLSDNKKTIIPWILLCTLTLVQVVGNVFSVYKYIDVSNSGEYIYLQKSLIDWWLSGVEQSTIMVIISWIIGALLPIIALFMTSMVANNIRLRSAQETQKNDEINVPTDSDNSNSTVENENIEDVVSNEQPKPEQKKKRRLFPFLGSNRNDSTGSSIYSTF